MNYYRRYVGNYLKKTARLSMLDHGAYNLMLDYYYADEKPLPLDMDELYVMVRAMTPADRKSVDKVLERYFTRQSDGFHNERADHEIDVSKKARANGSKGGRPVTEEETGLLTGNETEQETETDTGTDTGDGGGSGHPPNHLTTSLQPSTQQPRSKAKVAAVPLPPWLNADTWTAYVQSRPARARKPDALKAVLAKLESYRSDGHDANEIVATSLANGWHGLFAPKDKPAKSNPLYAGPGKAVM